MTTPERRSGASDEASPSKLARPRKVKWEVLRYVLIALCVMAMLHDPLTATFCLGMVIRSQVDRVGPRACRLSLAVVAFALSAMAVWTGPAAALPMAASVAAAAAIAVLSARHRASVSAVSLVVAICAVADMAVDALVLAWAGEGITDVLFAMTESIARSSAGTGVEASLAVTSVMAVFESIWPIVYVSSTLLTCALAAAGSYVSAWAWRDRTVPGTPQVTLRDRLASFDAPLWTVGVLAVSLVGASVGSFGFAASDAVTTVFITVALSVRFIFMLQGFGVVVGVMRRLGAGWLLTSLVVGIAISLEAMFVLSIVGLVDVWANFRKLSRGSARTETLR